MLYLKKNYNREKLNIIQNKSNTLSLHKENLLYEQNQKNNEQNIHNNTIYNNTILKKNTTNMYKTTDTQYLKTNIKLLKDTNDIHINKYQIDKYIRENEKFNNDKKYNFLDLHQNFINDILLDHFSQNKKLCNPYETEKKYINKCTPNIVNMLISKNKIS